MLDFTSFAALHLIILFTLINFFVFEIVKPKISIRNKNWTNWIAAFIAAISCVIVAKIAGRF